MPSLPMPDALVTQLLVAIFGPGALIVLGFTIANFAWSWYGIAKSGMRVGRASASLASRLAVHIMRIPPVALFVKTVISFSMLILQGVWLWSCYVVGNAWSYFFTSRTPTRGPNQGPQWDRMLSTLHWDAGSKVYMVASIAALMAAYVLAAKGQDVTRPAYLLTLPAVLVGLLSGLGAALALLLAALKRISDGQFVFDPFGKAALLLTAIIAVYVVSCVIAMRTVELLYSVWTSKR